jgi:hypothetical protein
VSDEKEKSKRTRAVIDRIEDGGTAVLLVGEEEHKVELPASLLPEGADAGSHLVLTIALDEASRGEAEERVKALQEKLEKRGGGEGRKDFKL